MKRWLLLLLSLVPVFAIAQETLTLGIFAYRPKPVMAQKFDMLGVYLTGAIPGHSIRIEYLDHAEMNTALAEQRLDLIFTNPSHYVQLRHGNRLSGALATLQTLENGQATALLGGVIIARPDSPLHTLQDIRGQRLAIPGAGAMFLGGYQTQAFELQQVGINLPDDAKITDARSHDKVVEAVISGAADVGFIRTGVIEALQREGKLAPGALKVINPQQYQNFPFAVSTRLYPEWAFAALPSVPEDIVKRINRALLFITPDMAVAEAAGIHGFTIPGDYQMVDQLTRALRLPPYQEVDIRASDVWKRYDWLIFSALLALGIIIALAFRLWRTRLARTREAERLQTITDTIADGIYVLDADGRLTLVNPAFCEILGYPESDVLGRIGHEIFHHHDGNQLPLEQCKLFTTVRSGGAYHGEERFRCRDGRLIDVEIAARPILDTHGNPTGSSVNAFHDITGRKRTEAELEQHRHNLEALVEERTTALSIAKEAAEAANRAKSTFLANMSHELRTPMNAIMGMTGMVLRQTGDTRLREQLGKVETASKHLLHVINDILDISKIEAERMKLEQVDFLLGSILENLRSLAGHRASEKGLQLHIELPAELATLSLVGDPLRLGQILLNLTGNAIKFTRHGSVTVRTRLVEIAGNAVSLCFEVADTGIGIAPEARERLFTAFEQADNSMTRKYGGTGLGLAISKRLVHLMDGEIGVDSTPDEGTTFWFTVRLRHTQRSIAPIVTRDSAEHEIRREHAAARILLAEDEPINREVSLCLLEDCGLCVDTAEDGQQAVDRARSERYALILMDMQMPVMNGVEATQAIRADSLNRHTPIIAMTANAFAEDRAHCLAAGMNDHLGKPVDPEHLFSTLLKWLRKGDNNS